MDLQINGSSLNEFIKKHMKKAYSVERLRLCIAFGY